MYAKIKTYLETLKSKVAMQRIIIGAICVLFLYGVGSLASGYFTARGNYQRAIERLERTQRALDDSRRLNRELNKIIGTSQQLNSDADDRIKRIESNQRETGSRISESLEQNNRARAELNSSLELIRRIEKRNQE